MHSPTDSDEFDPPKQSLSGKIAGAIERFCIVGARVSIPVFVPVGGVFIVYLIGGYALIALDVWMPSYEFLSLAGDIYFAWLGFLSGLVISFGTGSLIGLAFLTEGEGRIHNEVSILTSFIGFGFGGGLIRMTYSTVLTTLL